MTFAFLGPDPVARQIDEALVQVAAGVSPKDIETPQLDFKEEHGRRGPGGTVRPGATSNEHAARHIADELACMANTVGGGALVLGIADDGTKIGTEIEADWLRHRIYEITNRQLTVDVNEVDLSGTRVLVLRTHEAIEPIRNARSCAGERHARRGGSSVSTVRSSALTARWKNSGA